MKDLLKEKLWDYILHNNPDLMFALQENYSVSHYLNEKVDGIQSLIADMQAEGTSSYIIEEVCLHELTEDLKPSQFNYIRSLMEQEFESAYIQFYESGILTYEVINLIESCKEVFEIIGFTTENEEDATLRNALIGQIADSLNEAIYERVQYEKE